MTPIELPMLPSPILREHYREAIAARIEHLKPELRDILLDGLGDLALAFARRPLRFWHGDRETLARALGDRWVWPEATAVIELGTQVGLLVPCADEGQLRPCDVGHFTWLGARRIARTQDQDGLMDHRLNGGLFDMFALAAALLDDAEGAAGIVQLMSDSPGPFEDLLELGPALAAAAVAWGAAATPELRLFLTERALAWTQPMGADWNREIGTAILVLECQRSEEREHLMHIASEVLTELIQTALSDEELSQQPAVLATLDTMLAMLVAGAAPRPSVDDAGALVFRAPAVEHIRRIVGLLPQGHAHRVGRAVARILPPGRERNELLVYAARLARDSGDPSATAPLEALAPPYDLAATLIDEVVQAARTEPDDPYAEHIALRACHAVRTWDTCPAPILLALAGLLGDQVRPALRMAAGAALGRHDFEQTPEASDLLRALEESFQREETSREQMAGSGGALLHLGSRHERLAPVALALITDVLADTLKKAVAEALDVGLRKVPEHVDELVQFHRVHEDRPEVIAALLFACGVITDTAQIEHDLGPFSTTRPLPEHVRDLLLTVLIPLASSLDDPYVAAEAATACAGLLRGDETLAGSLMELRASADDVRVKSLYDLALGVSRVFIPGVIDRLGRDAAQADPDVAAAACVALRVSIETFAQAQHLEPWLPAIRGRLEESGPHEVPALQLVAQLATLPLGE